MNKTMVAHL